MVFGTRKWAEAVQAMEAAHEIDPEGTQALLARAQREAAEAKDLEKKAFKGMFGEKK